MASTMSSIDEIVATLCAALEKEPLFHMSLGSKELFHSNFLAPQSWSFALAPSVLASAHEERRKASKVKSVPLRSHRLAHFVQTYSIRARK